MFLVSSSLIVRYAPTSYKSNLNVFFSYFDADNPISEMAFRYLKCLAKLVKLDATGTNVKVRQEYKKGIEK